MIRRIRLGRPVKLVPGPMQHALLLERLQVGAALAAEGVPADLARVTPSDRPDLADFQSNGALAAAKRLGKNPREIATAVAARLAPQGQP